VPSIGPAGRDSPAPAWPGHLQQGRNPIREKGPQGLGAVPEDGRDEDDSFPACLRDRRSGQHLAQEGAKGMILDIELFIFRKVEGR
jgi:hypothetical protein